MIELPEAAVIAWQMNKELKGKKIIACNCGNSPHKWVFYKHKPGEFKRLLNGKTIKGVTAEGKWVYVSLPNDQVLLFGEMGGKILWHKNRNKLPEKYHFMLELDNQACVSVTVKGWGFIHLLKKSQISIMEYAEHGYSPIDKGFTFEYFTKLVGADEEGSRKSVKMFVISQPRIKGIGNGYLQDILFRAGIHPTRQIADINAKETRKLYDAITKTMDEAIKKGGRDDERDFYNNPGTYQRTLDKRAKGQPCPICKTTIKKTQYLGGASYFCPKCQV